MAAWDDIALEDMTYKEEEDTYTFPCPCGDDFFITVDDLLGAEDLAPCPSCSLLIRVVYDPEEFLESVALEDDEDEDQQDQDQTSAAAAAGSAALAEDSKAISETQDYEHNETSAAPSTGGPDAELASALQKLELAADGSSRDVDVVDV